MNFSRRPTIANVAVTHCLQLQGVIMADMLIVSIHYTL